MCAFTNINTRAALGRYFLWHKTMPSANEWTILAILLAATVNCIKTNFASSTASCKVSFNLPVSGLAGTEFLGGSPFYSYRWSFSKQCAIALMRLCLFLVVSRLANKGRSPAAAVRRCVAEGWTERRENLPRAELTAPVTVRPIKAQEEGPYRLTGAQC